MSCGCKKKQKEFGRASYSCPDDPDSAETKIITQLKKENEELRNQIQRMRLKNANLLTEIRELRTLTGGMIELD